MKIALIARSTLFAVPGGDTVQVTETCRFLNKLGIHAEVKLSSEAINYRRYDMLHFFNLVRPADILQHVRKAKLPYVVSTIMVNYSEYDKHHRKGLASIFNHLGADGIEYMKTIARCLLGRDRLASREYVWKGQRRSIMEILRSAAMILPNSQSEYSRIMDAYPARVKYMVVPNGVDPDRFSEGRKQQKQDDMVLCVARIEGIKNQINLIKGLNNTGFKVLLIGSESPGQVNYYKYCTNIAADNIRFVNHLPQQQLVDYYQRAKVHILPSWFETTGLASLEAAAMGCNVVISNRGDAKEYFGNHAFYCDPAEPESLLHAVQQASIAPCNDELRKTVLENYTWQHAATKTLQAYRAIL